MLLWLVWEDDPWQHFFQSLIPWIHMLLESLPLYWICNQEFSVSFISWSDFCILVSYTRVDVSQGKLFSEISSEVEACRGRGRKKPGASSSAVLWLAGGLAPEQSCAVIGGNLLGPGAAARRCRSRHLSWDLRPQKLERKSEAGGYWGTSKEWRWTAGD